jgi:hypothetical protein
MADQTNQQVFLPLSLFYPIQSEKGFSSEAKVIFQGKESIGVENNEVTFQHGTLIKVQKSILDEKSKSDVFSSADIPYFSLASILTLIIFRNRFYSAFIKYFISLRNNYEIDFNLQRIGFLPISFCLLVIFFSVSDLLKDTHFQGDNQWGFIVQIKSAFLLLGLPILFSCTLFFLLDFSGKIFPLIFSDIKVLFFLSIFVLIWNLSSFGAQIELIVSKEIFFLSIGSLYLIIRSFLFFNVFMRAYRFRIPVTLFYICVLNLTSFFFLTKGLPKDFFIFL